MSNSIESYSQEVFSKAVGKKNIRLQKDLLYTVDVLEEYEDKSSNNEIKIFCNMEDAVKEYERYEEIGKQWYYPNCDVTVRLYQCFWDRTKKQLNKLLEIRKCEINRE